MTIARLLTLLARFESHLPANRRMSGRLPPLLILTDEARGFSLRAQLQAWPQGAAFIERTFGNSVTVADYAINPSLRLASCTFRQAYNTNINGVHWPQNRLKYRMASKAHGMIETTSAHSGLALAKAARLGMDAILVSTAFQSDSPSAKRPLGAIRLAKLQRAFPQARIYALGGISLSTARLLPRARLSGVALVSFADIDNTT